jgi:hypothetical protein
VHDWLGRASSVGLGPPPVTSEGALPAQVALAAGAIIRHARLSDEALVVGANGSTFDAPACAEVLDLLERLAAGQRIETGGLGAQTRALVAQLWTAGALSEGIVAP